MKLITETVEDVQPIVESNEAGGKVYKLRGVMMESDTKNRNGRIYENRILSKECKRYILEYVQKNRALGELNHPSGPTVNLDRVSHMITSLKENGKQVLGEAKIIDTPMGNIVKGLIESGANLGASSRGLGSMRENKMGIMEVQSDFRLSTAADIVAEPSAPGAFVKGIMEGVEY